MADPLAAEYFDGLRAVARPVQLHAEAGRLRITGDGIDLAVPLREVRWPERTRHGIRVAELPDGATLQCADAAAWDRFALDCGRREPLVVRLQQSWRAVLAGAIATVLLLGWLHRSGIPMAAGAALVLVPEAVDRQIGDAVLATLDEHLLQPSRLSAAQREQLQGALARALAAQPAGTVPAHRLEFRQGRIGPNALALPGGTIVLTDELVALVDGDPAIVTGVLAHELGHVRQRDGMRTLLQTSALGLLSSTVIGDFSTIAALAPVVLGQASYSRDTERAADAESARLLADAGISPAVMVEFFQRAARWQAGGRGAPGASGGASGAETGSPPGGIERLGIAIASHPADAERMKFFRDAAARR